MCDVVTNIYKILCYYRRLYFFPPTKHRILRINKENLTSNWNLNE